MPRRSSVTLLDVASRETLAAAFWRAARGKRTRADVLAFSERLSAQLDALRDEILGGRAPEGRWTEFRVWDPKPRRILAPCFPDRVLHHALVAHLEPVLERALVDDTFACRAGKGTLAAVLRAQQHLRRFPWFVKVDVRAYFASIDHTTLLGLLARRFKDPGVLALAARILEGRTTALELQAGYASALAITAHADAIGFLRAELLRMPAEERSPLSPALSPDFGQELPCGVPQRERPRRPELQSGFPARPSARAGRRTRP